MQSSYHTTLCFLPSYSSSIPFYISSSFTPTVFPLLKLHCFLGVRESASVSCFLPSEAGIKWFRHQKEDNIWRNGNLLMLNFSHWREVRKEPCSKKNTREEGTGTRNTPPLPLPRILWLSIVIEGAASVAWRKEGGQSRQDTEFLCQDVQHRRNVRIFLLQKHLLAA